MPERKVLDVPNRLFPIIIATQDHIFHGSVATRGSRVFEVLSHGDSDYLLLQDVRVHQRKRSNRPVHVAECLLYKAELLFAIPTIDKHESPEKRWNAFVEKKQFVTFLTLPGYSIAGCLHINGSADLVSIATLQLESFIPISDATIVSVGDEGLPREVPTVIVNKRFMSSFAIHEGGGELPGQTAPATSSQAPAADRLDNEIADLTADLWKLVNGAGIAANQGSAAPR